MRLSAKHILKRGIKTHDVKFLILALIFVNPWSKAHQKEEKQKVLEKNKKEKKRKEKKRGRESFFSFCWFFLFFHCKQQVSQDFSRELAHEFSLFLASWKGHFTLLCLSLPHWQGFLFLGFCCFGGGEGSGRILASPWPFHTSEKRVCTTASISPSTSPKASWVFSNCLPVIAWCIGPREKLGFFAVRVKASVISHNQTHVKAKVTPYVIASIWGCNCSGPRSKFLLTLLFHKVSPNLYFPI